MPQCMIFSGPGRVLLRSFLSADIFFGTYMCTSGHVPVQEQCA